MTKYDEIMENISLSPEARNRIIDNIADEMSSDTVRKTVRKTSRAYSWKKYLTVAACCVLVIAGVSAASRNGLFISLGGGSADDAREEEYSSELNSASSEEAGTDGEKAAELQETPDYVVSDSLDGDRSATASGTDRVYIDSEEELSDRLGFSMNCESLQRLSEDAGLGEVSYIAYRNDMGEVIFSDGDRINWFRKAAGTEDISGNYEDHSTEVEFDGEYRSGTLKGKVGDYKLAAWTTADGYTYAAYVENGLTDKEWFELIDELTGRAGN